MIFSKTKYIVVLAFSVLIGISCRSVFSMETPKKNHLQYLSLAFDGSVKMCYPSHDKETIVGCNILDIIGHDLKKLFTDAILSKGSVCASCKLGEKEKSAIAKIIPLFGKDAGEDEAREPEFFVKVYTNIEEHKTNGHLYFGLLSNRFIELCLADGMDFDVPKEVFLGKDILFVLDEDQKEPVKQAFDEAASTKEPTKTTYNLKEKNFTANIVPLFGENDVQGFFVEVSENQ